MLEVNAVSEIVWRYAGDLRFAHSAKRLANGNTLIADTNNDRVIEVTPRATSSFHRRVVGGTGRLSDGSHSPIPTTPMPSQTGRS